MKFYEETALLHHNKKTEGKEKNEHEQGGNLEILELDKMKNFKFYFVQNNFSTVMKKLKKKKSPRSKRSSHSPSKFSRLSRG